MVDLEELILTRQKSAQYEVWFLQNLHHPERQASCIAACDQAYDSVQKSTFVKEIVCQEERVKISTESEESGKVNYVCDDAIIAFRPDGLDKKTLADITAEEENFFDDLGYNGYIPSIWKMDVGQGLLDVGVNL